MMRPSRFDASVMSETSLYFDAPLKTKQPRISSPNARQLNAGPESTLEKLFEDDTFHQDTISSDDQPPGNSVTHTNEVPTALGHAQSGDFKENSNHRREGNDKQLKNQSDGEIKKGAIKRVHRPSSPRRTSDCFSSPRKQPWSASLHHGKHASSLTPRTSQRNLGEFCTPTQARSRRISHQQQLPKQQPRDHHPSPTLEVSELDENTTPLSQRLSRHSKRGTFSSRRNFMTPPAPPPNAMSPNLKTPSLHRKVLGDAVENTVDETSDVNLSSTRSQGPKKVILASPRDTCTIRDFNLASPTALSPPPPRQQVTTPTSTSSDGTGTSPYNAGNPRVRRKVGRARSSDELAGGKLVAGSRRVSSRTSSRNLLVRACSDSSRPSPRRQFVVSAPNKTGMILSPRARISGTDPASAVASSTSPGSSSPGSNTTRGRRRSDSTTSNGNSRSKTRSASQSRRNRLSGTDREERRTPSNSSVARTASASSTTALRSLTRSKSRERSTSQSRRCGNRSRSNSQIDEDGETEKVSHPASPNKSRSQRRTQRSRSRPRSSNPARASSRNLSVTCASKLSPTSCVADEDSTSATSTTENSTPPSSKIASSARKVFSLESHSCLSTAELQSKQEESKTRRSNILKSIRDLLKEEEHFQITQDGSKKQLVIDLSDLNSVMGDMSVVATTLRGPKGNTKR